MLASWVEDGFPVSYGCIVRTSQKWPLDSLSIDQKCEMDGPSDGHESSFGVAWGRDTSTHIHSNGTLANSGVRMRDRHMHADPANPPVAHGLEGFHAPHGLSKAGELIFDKPKPR